MHLIVSVAFVTGCSSEESGSCGEIVGEEGAEAGKSEVSSVGLSRGVLKDSDEQDECV